MPADTPDQSSTALPSDVTDISVLRQMLAVPASIHESVAVRLSERGRLFAFRNGVRPTLAGQADYLAALSEFCDTVPGAAGALAANRAIQQAKAREQGPVDQAIRETERQKGKQP
jgi:hypothetical protein